MTTLLKIVILGILTAVAALVAEQLLAVFAAIISGQEVVFSQYNRLANFIILAALVEEGLKYAALRYAVKEKFGATGKSLVFAGFLVGLFFGITEVGLILFSDPEAKKSLLNFDRDAVFSLSSIILVQTAASLLMGSLIAVQEEVKRFSFLKILFFPVAIHLLYNFLIIQRGNYTEFLVWTVLGITFIVNFFILAFNFRRLD